MYGSVFGTVDSAIDYSLKVLTVCMEDRMMCTEGQSNTDMESVL